MQVIDAIAARFELDSLTAKVRGASQGAGREAGQGRAHVLADAAVPLAEQAVRKDDFKTAIRLNNLAATALQPSKDLARVRRIKDRSKEIALLKKQYFGSQPALARLADQGSIWRIFWRPADGIVLLRGIGDRASPCSFVATLRTWSR